MKNNGTITIYACGGAGLNIGSYFEKYRGTPSAGFAEVNVVYIDTSKSNLNEVHSPDYTYTFEGMDGSGKIRRENAAAISESVMDIIHKFKPGNLSIVLSSLSGGTGSVIAPSIVSELLARNENVIVCAVSSNDSRIEIENNIKTLKSYESVAKLRKSPVVMLYRENSTSTPRKETDDKIRKEIVMLAALFSGQNNELDTSDLHNWLYYNRVSSFDPKLSLLEFYNDTINDVKHGTVVTVASIANKDESTTCGMLVEYQCVGFVDDKNKAAVNIGNRLHFAVLDGVVMEIFKSLSDSAAQLDEAKNARISRGSILSKDDNAENNGLVL